MKFLTTPNARFNHLKDYPFQPNFTDVDGMQMHYVDEGSKNTDPVLMLHGEPSWSYLYRKMIPICANAGHRVLAPDLIGFGKSDKPTQFKDYSYAKHLHWLQQFIDNLELNNITLVCQDWGSLLGLRLLTANTDRFKAVVIGNGFLPTGEHPVPKAFKIWRNFAKYSPWFPIGKILNSGSITQLSSDEIKAYDAPFPSKKFKAGTRAFPMLVPTKLTDPEAQNNRLAWKILEQWHKPFLTTFSNKDPIMRGGEKHFQKRVPGAQGLPHVILRGGHFLQEDSPKEFAEAINQLLKSMT
ncbi:MAG: haloalkane dehalogenase [Marinicellaceae bacterium]